MFYLVSSGNQPTREREKKGTQSVFEADVGWVGVICKLVSEFVLPWYCLTGIISVIETVDGVGRD